MLKIMIIEDEKDHFELMEGAIRKEFPDAVVELCEKGDFYLKRLEETDRDIIITDYLLAGMTGLEILEELKRRKIDVPVIMVTGHGDEELAVKAMRLGAFDYLAKTDAFFEIIPQIIHKAIYDRELKAKVRQAEEEKKRLQDQLQQSQKMEAIGTLAGGIAHDFNNLLMGIQGNISLMLLDTDAGHPNFERLKGIETLIERAAGLTRQLLGFARRGKYEVKPTDLNKLIQRSSKLFGRTRKEIEIHTKYQQDLWPAEIDRGQIDQVLLNLYINAGQAMPDGGELYLETKNIVLDQDYSQPFIVKPGPYVKVSMTDTGVGMDAKTRKRIFEPFFTTREPGQGTGLGLASAYGIIKNHSGFINVYSEKNHGTTFNIYLPVAGTDSKAPGPKRDDKDEMLKGTETILLVDDEAMIIDVCEQMLKKLGYKTYMAGSGKKAIELYKKNRDTIDMVILDMIMPDLGGNEVYDRLKEINPQIKVLLSSGYALTGKASDMLERGCNSFLKKPFSLKELSQKIKEVLAS